MKKRSVWDLPDPKMAAFHGDVARRFGEVAAASLECVLLDGARRFMGIPQEQAELIHVLARVHGVDLPFESSLAA
jgi:hypothetical protein